MRGSDCVRSGVAAALCHAPPASGEPQVRDPGLCPQITDRAANSLF